jgi:hypothetical protein
MKELLKQVKLYSKSLARASKWNGSDESIAAIEAQKNKTNGTDYVYEFFCYLVILSDLKKNYKLKFVEGSGDFKYAFPKSPALKKGKPYFSALDKDTLLEMFQICAGTKISTGFTSPKDRAPDISFQKARTKDDPRPKDVYMIFDAKFNRPSSSKKSTDQNQFSYVSQMIRDLKLNNACTSPILFDKLVDMLGNCIITNGKSTNSDAARNISNSLKEVENFSAPFNLKKIKVIG